MRKFIAVFFILTLVFGGMSKTAYAVDCTKDTLMDKFGDWFGNLGKKEKRKNQVIATRKANRLAECTEKQAREAARHFPEGRGSPSFIEKSEAARLGPEKPASKP